MKFSLIARITCIKKRLTGRSHWSCLPIRYATSRKGVVIGAISILVAGVLLLVACRKQ